MFYVRFSSEHGEYFGECLLVRALPLGNVKRTSFYEVSLILAAKPSAIYYPFDGIEVFKEDPLTEEEAIRLINTIKDTIQDDMQRKIVDFNDLALSILHDRGVK